MKILLISPLPPPVGGIATWTVGYSRYCEMHGIPLSIVDNALVGAKRKKQDARRSLADEIRRSWHVAMDLIRKIRREKPDIVHLNTACTRLGVFRDLLCAMIVHLSSVPLVVQCHCNIEDQLHGRLAKWAFCRLIKSAVQVFTLNRCSQAYVSGCMPGRAAVLPNFIDVNNLFERTAVSPVIRRVVFVGHVRKEKGAEEILAAAKQLPEMEFVLIGPVHEHMSPLACSDNVQLLGSQPHDKVLWQLREADVFIFPSHTEGFSNSLLEAMASGLPVVATDVGANAAMIEDKGGRIIPLRNAKALSEAIKTLNEAPDKRLEMAKWNAQKVKNCYSTDAVMEKMLAVYETLIRQ